MRLWEEAVRLWTLIVSGGVALGLACALGLWIYDLARKVLRGIRRRW